jgi:hypothetical protein
VVTPILPFERAERVYLATVSNLPSWSSHERAVIASILDHVTIEALRDHRPTKAARTRPRIIKARLAGNGIT